MIESPRERDGATQHIRSSSVLLLGKFISLALQLATQVLLVRYLSRSSFGAFSYALAAVAFFQGFATFEMPNALSRWVPLLREKGEPGAAAGIVVMSFAFVLVTGVLMATALVLAVPALGSRLVEDAQARVLLVILASLIPLQSVDAVITGVFAVLGDARAIVIRGSIIAPGLRVLAVGVMMTIGADATWLAFGYLAVSAIGLSYYGWTLWRALVRRGLLRAFRRTPRRYPARDLLGFAAPLMLTVLVWSLMESSDAFLLGHFHGVDLVATFRAALPVAQLNKVVVVAFGALYLPAAARFFAQGAKRESSELYWRTTLWQTVLTFPVFLCTFSFARTLTATLYGSAYAKSAPVMALLSLGYFFSAALGPNGSTLKTFNKLRYTVGADLTAIVLNIAVNLVAIPRWGALGAAVGTCSTMIVHNVLKQVGLERHTGIAWLAPAYVRLYGAIGVLALVLAVVQTVLPARLWIAIPSSMAASLLVLRMARRHLDASAVFPELGRWMLALRKGAATLSWRLG